MTFYEAINFDYTVNHKFITGGRYDRGINLDGI